MTPPRHVLFLLSASREAGHIGNTETLARRAAARLPADTRQTWLPLSQLQLPPFVDVRHTVGSYAPPEGDLKTALDALLDCSDLVVVAPVYWFSLPAPLKLLLDHWSGFLRVPGLDFKARMAGKRFWAISTSGHRGRAQPMLDSLALCAEFMGMAWQPPLWGQGGAPGAVLADAAALAEAERFFLRAPA